MPYRTTAAAASDADIVDTNSYRSTTTTRTDTADGGSRISAKKSSTSSLPIANPTNNTNRRMTTVGLSQDTIHSTGTRSNFTSRRRQSSIPKAPMGPRAMDLDTGKRSVSHSLAPPFNNVRGASAVASQDPYTNQLSINDISRFSFASIIPKPSPQDEREDPLSFGNFLEPTFNFDDFHDHITSTEPSLNHFPLPGGTGAFQPPDAPASQQKKGNSQPAIPIPARKGSGANVLARKGSTASNGVKVVNKAETMSASTSILRGRRQSQFPPNAFNNNTTGPKAAPRKSIGPGTFVAPETTENVGVGTKRTPSVGGRKSSAGSAKTSQTSRPGYRRSDNSNDGSKSPKPVRSRGHLGPSRQNSKDILSPAKTPDSTRPPSVRHTPNRRSGTPGRTTTPGGANGLNRRVSTMPHHATGLGARTVSPTDARRMKRMSIVPPAPPLPQSRISQAPPTPNPETAVPTPNRTTVQSPIVPNRKSLTPSSSRTTPDPNRKSYSSGQSLSSSTSYNSIRAPPTLSTRLSQSLSTSRLPTVKPRTEPTSNSGNNMEGEVPPVPAIPKAYESPSSEVDQPFFSARSSSLPPVDSPISASPIVTSLAEAMSTLETPRAPSSSSRISSGPNTEIDKQKAHTNKLSKKNPHSLRLPPLNLLPLSTPTAVKIKSFKDSRTDQPGATITPPQIPTGIKTPSTPMTASKASFFSKGQRTEDNLVIRSSTSHHTLRTDGYRRPSDESPNLPVFSFESDMASSRNISPFVSSSLPKNNSDFSIYMRPNFSTELNRSTIQQRPSGPRAPSFSITPKTEIADSPLEKTEKEMTTSASTSTLRRKLSRKRSESRVTETPEQSFDTNKFGGMPPPKLPASASWTNSKGSSPVHKPTTYLRSRRQTSGSSINTAPERQNSYDSTTSYITAPRPSVESSRSLMAQSSHSNLGNTQSHPAKQQEALLDRDDMIAEEEMKKLAHKRKDFESAARELDALRARARPVQRISPTTAAHTFTLNIFERGEIVDFADVYFTGTKTARKIVGDLSAAATNFGYDDERGDYNIVEGDHLAYRYEVVDVLGKGSFGQVVRCVDHKTGILVAVKIIRNKKRFHQQALVEVNILQKLKEWDPQKKHSVVNFDQEFYFRGHLCISTDLLGMNLYEFIKAHDFRGFSLKLIRRFTKQLLSSLVLLQSKKVIHCDLKPENILLVHPVHSEIKVIDFGSSCFENEKVYTYIQSRFYRSPEVILGMSYGMPIDMWSVGCILAELYTGYPIFPGENEQEQLACIMEIFGPPEKHLIEKSSRKKLFFDSMGKPRLTVSSKGRRRRPSSKDLRQALKCDDEAFLDFIARCLRWDPHRRIGPIEASKHEFITGIKQPIHAPRKGPSLTTGTPIKRGNSINASGGARPLPQPPSSLKPTLTTRQDSLNPSPNKGASRRQTTLTSTQPIGHAKRASHAAMNSSNTSLNKVSTNQRNANGRPDLATAAAAASLIK